MLNAGQAYVAEILAELLTSTPECAALWAPDGRLLREGELLRNPELGDALSASAREGAEPFYRGDIAAAVVRLAGRARRLAARGGPRAAIAAIEREPVEIAYRDREILTNPPPSAGGTLLAYALALLDRGPGAADAAGGGRGDGRGAVRAHARVRRGSRRGGLPRALPGHAPRLDHAHLGDRRRRAACSATCTNGEGSGVVVPGTGMHLNNVMGEEDLNPLGFHRHPAGRRMPSMMAPSIVLRDGEVELVLGSAGSNRIRSALLQTIVGGRRSRHERARRRWRRRACTSRTESLFAEPGIELAELERRHGRGALRRAQPVLRRRPGGAAQRRSSSRVRAIRAAAGSR